MATSKKKSPKKSGVPGTPKPATMKKIRVTKCLWGAFNMPHDPGMVIEVAAALADEIVENEHGEFVD